MSQRDERVKSQGSELYDPQANMYYKRWAKTYEKWEKYEGWWHYVRWQLQSFHEHDDQCVEAWSCHPVENGPPPIKIGDPEPPTHLQSGLPEASTR